MARPEKVAAVAEIRERLTESDAAVLTEYRGLKVSELAELRGALRPAGTDFKIFKNTLARRAAEEAGLAELVPMLEGPTAIAFVKGDAVIAAKALRDFGRTNAALVVKGGLLGTDVLGAARRHRARRRGAPRGAPRPPRRRVPGPDGQGGGPVPGLHPQHGLRHQGPDRPADRGRREPPGRRAGRRAAADAPADAPTRTPEADAEAAAAEARPPADAPPEAARGRPTLRRRPAADSTDAAAGD